MKNYLAICLFLTGFQLSAQNRFEPYLEVGFSRSISFYNNHKGGYSGIYTPFFGLKTRYQIKPCLLFESGVQYIQNNYEYFSEERRYLILEKNYAISRVNIKSELSKICIPIVFHYQFNQLKFKPEFSVGLRYNRIMRGNYFETNEYDNLTKPGIEIQDTTSFDPISKHNYMPLKRNYFQYNFGLGFQIVKNIRIAFNVATAINGDEYVEQNEPYFWSCISDSQLFYRNNYMLSLMYKLN